MLQAVLQKTIYNTPRASSSFFCLFSLNTIYQIYIFYLYAIIVYYSIFFFVLVLVLVVFFFFFSLLAVCAPQWRALWTALFQRVVIRHLESVAVIGDCCCDSGTTSTSPFHHHHHRNLSSCLFLDLEQQQLTAGRRLTLATPGASDGCE